MNKKEFTYKGICINGFLALLVAIAILACSVYFFVLADKDASMAVWGVLLIAVFSVFLNGFIKQEPNEAKVLVFFGKYSGTFEKTGFFWVFFYFAVAAYLNAKLLEKVFAPYREEKEEQRS